MPAVSFTTDPRTGVETISPVGGLPARNYSPAYGGIPQVPDPLQSATAAIGGGVSNLGSLYGLGTGLSNITGAEARGQYVANLPDYAALTARASEDIMSNLRGEVPPDVWNALQIGAAERGTAIGAPGSDNANAALLRALGLTSLDLQKLGQTQLTGAVQRTPTGPLFDPSKMVVTPDQIQQARAAQALYNAAPVPSAAAGAALGAAQSGIRAGAGAPIYGGGVSAPRGNVDALGFPLQPMGEPGVMVGGYTGPGGEPATEAQTLQNWQDWYSSLPKGGWGTAETGYTPSDIDASIFGTDYESAGWGDTGYTPDPIDAAIFGTDYESMLGGEEAGYDPWLMGGDWTTMYD